MKRFLTDFHVEKLLLDSANETMPYYQYCKHNGIIPFIDLNEKRRIKEKYKDDFIIGKDSIPVCKTGSRCPLVSRKYGCSCDSSCSGSKYGRTVHLSRKDNPHLINIPTRDSEQWKKEYNARVSLASYYYKSVESLIFLIFFRKNT